MSKARTEEVMRRYLTEVLGEQKFELIPDFVAEDMVDHTQAMRGPAALDAHARGFCGNIPDLEIEVKQIFATDDAAIGVWRWRGTPTHPMGVSANGNPINPQHIASIFQFKDGMLSDYRPFVDAVNVAMQIAAPAKSSDDGPSE